MAKWKTLTTSNDLRLMSETLGVSEIMARALANRGIASKNAAVKYLNPKLEFLADWRKMKDMEKAVGMVLAAKRADERVVVYGDYDADGVTATVILLKTLAAIGVNAAYYIPNREAEGYGLNMAAVIALKEAETDLLITCDNGISALEEIRLAKTMGMDVIVMDHHEPGFVEDGGGPREDVVPPADAVVDPKQKACGYPFKHMCAAGIAYRFAEAVYESMGTEFAFRDEFMALAALGTVCDIVPLLDENRIITKRGLAALNGCKQLNAGLLALLEMKNLKQKVMNVFDISYIVGPCVNASGRLGSAEDAVRLFMSDDANEIAELAEKAASLNEERKQITALAVERLLEKLDGVGELDKILVLYESGIHESVVGIIAGKIKETLYRPVIVLTDGAESVKGSARSIEGYNLYEALYRNRGLFLRFGGHAMAAGMTMERRNVDALRERLNATCELADEDFIPTLYTDGELELRGVTYTLTKELEALSPFGKDNPEPLFCAYGLRPEEARVINGKNTLIFTFAAGDANRKLRAVCFGHNEQWIAAVTELYDGYDASKILAGVLRGADFLMDVVYSPELNEYNGAVSVQIRLKDFRIYRQG